MITAKEALQKTKDARISFIENAIKEATGRGETEVKYTEKITDESKAVLEENGYAVTILQKFQGNPDITISWQNEGS